MISLAKVKALHVLRATGAIGKKLALDRNTNFSTN
jgi:hypothetical protein